MTTPTADPIDRRWVSLPLLIVAAWSVPVVLAWRWMRR